MSNRIQSDIYCCCIISKICTNGRWKVDKAFKHVRTFRKVNRVVSKLLYISIAWLVILILLQFYTATSAAFRR